MWQSCRETKLVPTDPGLPYALERRLRGALDAVPLITPHAAGARYRAQVAQVRRPPLGLLVAGAAAASLAAVSLATWSTGSVNPGVWAAAAASHLESLPAVGPEKPAPSVPGSRPTQQPSPGGGAGSHADPAPPPNRQPADGVPEGGRSGSGDGVDRTPAPGDEGSPHPDRSPGRDDSEHDRASKH
jgi:hypothetical protein